MGTSVMDHPVPNQTVRQDRAIIVELVGPACAGKTTLTRMLLQRSVHIEVATDISVRRPGHLLVFARTVPQVLPVLMHRRRNSRWFTWDEIKSIVYLKAWPRLLRQHAATSQGAVLVDQGPVFRLATLHAFGPDLLRRPSAATWWNQMFRQWASVLDLIIWLDAPNSILEQRINARERWHLVKGKPEQEASEFLERYRKSYSYVLRGISLNGGPRLIAFDTSRVCVEQVTSQVLAACGAHADRH